MGQVRRSRYVDDGLLVLMLIVAGLHQYVVEDKDSWKTFLFIGGWWTLVSFLHYARDRGWWGYEEDGQEE